MSDLRIPAKSRGRSPRRAGAEGVASAEVESPVLVPTG